MSTTELKRHAVDKKLVEELFREDCERLPTWVPTIRRRIDFCSMRTQSARCLISCGVIVEPTSPLIPRAVRFAGQALAGMFKVAAAGGESVSFPLDGEEVTSQGPVNESHLYPSKWLQAFFLNLLARQEEQIGWLMGFPRSIFHQSSTVSLKATHQLVDAVEAFWLDAKDADLLIEDAIQATKRPRTHMWHVAIANPILELMRSLRAGGDKFEPILIEGLRSHKKHWTATADLRRDWDGFIAYELSALAGLAYDRGIPFTVESDYLPMPLIISLGEGSSDNNKAD